MLLTLLTTAALATATPLKSRQWEGYPVIRSAPGVILVANITSPTKAATIFNPPVNHWYLSTARIGPGKNTAILSPNLSEASLLFVNGTGQDRSSTNTAILAPPLDTNIGRIPVGLQFTRSYYRDYGYVSVPGVNYGPGDYGTRIGVRDPYARLFPPYTAGPGTFAVCHEDDPAYGRPQYSVIWVEYDGQTGQPKPEPEGCVKIELLAQCAELPPLVGEKELGIINIGSLCYDDVKGTDWTKAPWGPGN
jgi:hypothetical protein